jgi:hypothetical protein
VKTGDLIRDTSDGSIGLVLSDICSYSLKERAARVYHKNEKYVMVYWPSNEGCPVKMDMSALHNGWVEVISESR